MPIELRLEDHSSAFFAPYPVDLPPRSDSRKCIAIITTFHPRNTILPYDSLSCITQKRWREIQNLDLLTKIKFTKSSHACQYHLAPVSLTPRRRQTRDLSKKLQAIRHRLLPSSKSTPSHTSLTMNSGAFFLIQRG